MGVGVEVRVGVRVAVGVEVGVAVGVGVCVGVVVGVGMDVEVGIIVGTGSHPALTSMARSMAIAMIFAIRHLPFAICNLLLAIPGLIFPKRQRQRPAGDSTINQRQRADKRFGTA